MVGDGVCDGKFVGFQEYMSFQKEIAVSVRMILSRLYVVYLWHSSRGGGIDAEGVWKSQKWRYWVKYR